MTGAFLVFLAYQVFFIHSVSLTPPSPNQKKNNPKNQKQDKMMVSSRKTSSSHIYDKFWKR